MQKPSEGRIVHFAEAWEGPGGSSGTLPRAAIITELAPVYDSDGRTPDGKLLPVGLAVVVPGGLFFTRNTEYDETGKLGTWRWPPRIS